ncbi:MAG TPA: hypothetical protein VF162_12030 [Streptosporangiaceae bacterium]
MRVMVFLHGTSIMHGSAVGVPRAIRVRQVTGKDPAVGDFATYVPTDGAVTKIAAWQSRGAEICYLSSHRTAAEAAIDGSVLAGHGFPAGALYYRTGDESYADVARRWQADVVVEDDCESIGGRAQTTASWLARSPGRAVPCVVVPEFGGLAHLPDDPAALLRRVVPPARRSRFGRLRGRTGA